MTSATRMVVFNIIGILCYASHLRQWHDMSPWCSNNFKEISLNGSLAEHILAEALGTSYANLARHMMFPFKGSFLRIRFEVSFKGSLYHVAMFEQFPPSPYRTHPRRRAKYRSRRKKAFAGRCWELTVLYGPEWKLYIWEFPKIGDPNIVP